jgi:hypothetical protein
MKTLHGEKAGSRQAGGIRFKLALFLGAVGLLASGGRGIYVAATNRTPTVVSYQECLKHRPQAAWLRVTNGVLDCVNACWLTRHGDDSVERSFYFVPLRDPNSPEGEVCILVKTTDPQIKKVILELDAVSAKPDADLKAWALQNVARVHRREDVQGVVISSWDMESTTRAELAKVQKNLAEDFIIIDASGQPNYLVSGATAGAGLLMLGLLGLTGLPKSDTPARKTTPLPVPKPRLPPTHCPMCNSAVVPQGNSAPRNCGQCGADLTRR